MTAWQMWLVFLESPQARGAFVCCVPLLLLFGVSFALWARTCLPAMRRRHGDV